MMSAALCLLTVLPALLGAVAAAPDAALHSRILKHVTAEDIAAQVTPLFLEVIKRSR
jgi:hypothetical protein